MQDQSIAAHAEHIATYVVPAKTRGWLAVAEVPVQYSQYWIPPRHERWRLTKGGAKRAIPKARAAVLRDLEQRGQRVAEREARLAQREDVS